MQLSALARTNQVPTPEPGHTFPRPKPKLHALDHELEVSKALLTSSRTPTKFVLLPWRSGLVRSTSAVGGGE